MSVASTLTPRIADICPREMGCLYATIANDSSAGPDNRAHRKDVQVGLQARGQTQVLSGVNPGDQVIVGGLDTVSDGAAISINK